jgi:Saxitoxin biosynthesis operon protein SxtJ
MLEEFGAPSTVPLAMHENFERHDEIKASSERAFGLVMAGFFAIVAALPLLHASRGVHWWAAALCGLFFLCALFWQAPLKPLNRLWLKLGLALHAVISPLILGLIFFLTVLPVGLLMRAFGKDPLRLRRDPGAASYWIVREPGPAPESMRNQF